MKLEKLTKEDIKKHTYELKVCAGYALCLAIVYSTWVMASISSIWLAMAVVLLFFIGGTLFYYFWVLVEKKKDKVNDDVQQGD